MFGRPRNASDSLPLKLFDARIALAEARDSSARRSLQSRVNQAQREFDSTIAMRTMGRFPRDISHDSLMSEIAAFGPQYQQQATRVRSDSALAFEEGPACGVDISRTGQPRIKFIVSDVDVARYGRVSFMSGETTGRGASVEVFGGNLRCSSEVQGEVRLFGIGAIAPSSIVVRASQATPLIVVSGSGNVLAGPITIKNETKPYELLLKR